MSVSRSPAPPARREELLEAAYRYGLAVLSSRPLAKEIGSSPRMPLYLFGGQDGLVRALLGRVRAGRIDTPESVAKPRCHVILVSR